MTDRRDLGDPRSEEARLSDQAARWRKSFREVQAVIEEQNMGGERDG